MDLEQDTPASPPAATALAAGRRLDASAGGGRLTGRTGLGAAILGCLLGAGLTLFAGAAAWVHTDVLDAATASGGAAAAPLGVTLRGGDLAPAVGAFGLLGLAASVALVATRGIGRQVVGVLVAAAGVGVMVYAGRVGADPGPVVRAAQHVVALAPSGHPAVGDIRVSAAPWAALVGGLALAAGGVLAVLFGRSWPAMGGRYQARTRRPVDVWDAIEHGQDPTVAAD
jgi:uncharacterized membrane protein (TIGR02234 family)